MHASALQIAVIAIRAMGPESGRPVLGLTSSSETDQAPQGPPGGCGSAEATKLPVMELTSPAEADQSPPRGRDLITAVTVKPML